MGIVTTRLTNTGNLLVNGYSGYFDETVQSTISTRGNVVYAALLDEVTYNPTSGVFTNLLTYSQNFSNSVWSTTLYDVTITPTSATAAPDSTATAYKLVSGTTSVYHATRQIVSGTIGNTYTLSIYAKAAEWTLLHLQVYDGASYGSYFNLSTGTLGSTSGTSGGITASISNIGNGWYRCSITRTCTGLFNSIYITGNQTEGGLYSGDGTSGIYIWGAQFELNSHASKYVSTGSTNAALASFAKREDQSGTIYVQNSFDEVTGMLVTNGLIAYIDAGKLSSFNGNGVTSGSSVPVFDLAANNKATMNGTVTWTRGGTYSESSYWRFATAGSGNYISSTLAQNYIDFTIVFQPDFTLSTSSGLVGLIASSTDATSNDKSLRFQNANGTGPWQLINPDNNDGWANSTTTYYINGVAYTGSANLSSGWNVLGGRRTNTTTGAFAGNFAYYLGTEGYSGDLRDFQGNIAAVAFYNRQLTAAEQLNNYNYFATRYGLPTIGL